MKAFTNDELGITALRHQHTTNARIGRGGIQALMRQIKRTLHVN
jgi:hypothetical protein